MAKASPTATKPAYMSTTLQGVALSLVPTVLLLLKHFNIELEEQSVTELMLALLGLVGAAIHIYGRLNPPKEIKKLTIL